MKKVFILALGIFAVLSFSLVSCQKKEAPREKSTVAEPAPEYGEEAGSGGYGEESESGGYGEQGGTGGYGGGY